MIGMQLNCYGYPYFNFYLFLRLFVDIVCYSSFVNYNKLLRALCVIRTPSAITITYSVVVLYCNIQCISATIIWQHHTSH